MKEVLKTTAKIAAMSLALSLCPLQASSQPTNEIEASRTQIRDALQGSSSIIVAARQTEREVVQFVEEFYRSKGLSEQDVVFTIFLSENGWLAISIGDLPMGECPALTQDLISQNLIPSDSYCSNANTFIAAFSVEAQLLVPVVGRNFFADAGTNATPQENLNSSRDMTYGDAVADVRTVLAENNLRVAYISTFSHENLGGSELLDFMEAFFAEFGYDKNLYALQEPGGRYRLVLSITDYNDTNSCGDFRASPSIFSYGPIVCARVQFPFSQSHDFNFENFLRTPQTGLQFNALIELSFVNGGVSNSVIAGSVLESDIFQREEYPNYIILTSLDVIDTLSQGVRISERGSFSFNSIASNGTEFEEYICNEALLNGAYWDRFVYESVLPFGFNGQIGSSYRTICSKGYWEQGALGEIIFASKDFLATNAIPNGYVAIGEISGQGILNFFQQVTDTKIAAQAAQTRRVMQAESNAEGFYSALLLNLPELVSSRDGGYEGIVFEVCYINEDRELASAYIVDIESRFKEHFSLLGLSKKLFRDDIVFSLNESIQLQSYDDAYARIQGESNSGYRYRDCDILFGEMGVLAEIKDRTLNWMFEQEARHYTDLVEHLVLAEAVSRQDLLEGYLKSTGYRTTEDADFGRHISAPSSEIVYALYEIGVSNKVQYDQLIDDLYEVWRRQLNWPDIENFILLAQRSGSYEAAIQATQEQVEERARQLQNERSERARDYPFYAVVSCGFRGSSMTLAACFVGDAQTTISIQTKQINREVQYFNFQSVGRFINNETALRIDLPSSYSIMAQNANDTLSVRLEIRRTIDNSLVYSEDQGRLFGVVAHRQ